MPVLMKVSVLKKKSLVLPKQYRASQPLPERMPVKDVNKGMKINRSTVCVAYTIYHNLHNPTDKLRSIGADRLTASIKPLTTINVS